MPEPSIDLNAFQELISKALRPTPVIEPKPEQPIDRNTPWSPRDPDSDTQE